MRNSINRRLTLLLWLILMVGLCTGCKTLEDMRAGTFRLEDIKLPTLGRAKAHGDSGNHAAEGSAEYLAAEFEKTEVPHVLLTKPVAEGRLTSRFGYRLNPSARFLKLPRRHKGIDYAADAGTPVYASGDGVVDRKYVSPSFGNYMRIEHANGFHSAYAHMQAFAEGIEEGTAVRRGQIIGVVGTTGRSTAPHLHYELLYKGRHIDPLFARQ